MFFITGLTLYKWWDFTHYDPTNEYKDPEESYERGEMFMLNVMWQIHINGYRFDFLLAMVAFLTWFKLFIYFRASLTFGPMFKILQQMLTDLSKFLAIWAIILVMFTCVGMLAFGQLDDFKVMV